MRNNFAESPLQVYSCPLSIFTITEDFIISLVFFYIIHMTSFRCFCCLFAIVVFSYFCRCLFFGCCCCVRACVCACVCVCCISITNRSYSHSALQIITGPRQAKRAFEHAQKIILHMRKVSFGYLLYIETFFVSSDSVCGQRKP